MKILFYILLPIATVIINVITAKIMGIIAPPFSLLLGLIEKFMGVKYESTYQLIYRFRLDFAILGLLHGIIVSSVILLIINKLNINISNLYIYVIFGLLSIFNLISWDFNRPFIYESCLLLSSIAGYIIGLALMS